jgi:hypothetical protein
VDVAVRPVYGPDWRSGIRVASVIAPLLRLVVRGMAARLVRGFQRRILGAPAVAMPEPPSS